MKHAHQVPSPIRICLQDSIFRRNNPNFPSFQTSYSRIHDGNSPLFEAISSFVPQPQQLPKFVEYVNAQYNGIIKDNKPFGTGIMIDDEMNFFLSQWENQKMNKLTFVKLLNETTIFGTWINGRIQGWNCFCIKNLKIFLQVKYRENFGQYQIFFGTGLVIDTFNNVCYLLQMSVDHRKCTSTHSQIRLQIINRLQIPFAIRKEYQQNISFLTQQIFAQYELKIPHFLSSLQTFMNHFSQNNPDVIFKEIPDQNELNFFISVQDSNAQNQVHLKSQAFNPYKHLINKDNREEFTVKNDKTLGLILKQKSYMTKSIGVFDSKYQLNGIGITVTHDNAKLFGHFKSNLLTKQFNNPEPQRRHMESFRGRQIKVKLKQHHMKSLNFVRDLVYFKQVDSTVKIVNQVVEYVATFQNEYKKRYGKAIDSFSASQQSFEAKYQNDELPTIEIASIKKNNLNQNMQKRPFGKIVNSRSPLRSIPKSHSKSPSDVETFRQRRPLDFHYVDRSPDAGRSQGKNMNNLKIHTHSAFNSRFNQQTSKNRSYVDSGMNSNISYQEALEAKIRQTQQEDIAETVRRRTQFTERDSQERLSRDRRMQDILRDRISQERRAQVNTGYKCRYDRLERRRDVFWKG